MIVFKDERGYTITEQELKAEYEDLRRNDETDAATYNEYIKNCTDKNGTLTLYEIENFYGEYMVTYCGDESFSRHWTRLPHL